MKITKNTNLCISIAKRPGNFGVTIFNAAFEALGLDFIYKPFQLDEENLKNAILGIRAFKIRGCAVSMPHKTAVIEYLDELDTAAKKIGAVNTIVNSDGVLKGYNTDYLGARRAIEEKLEIKQKKIVIIGTGGVARAIIMAVKELGAGEITLIGRELTKAKKLATEFNVGYASLNKLPAGDLLINATPVGMVPDSNKMVVAENDLANFTAIMDVVTNPRETILLKTAEKSGKITIAGYRMTVYQATAQFELYTGQKAPMKLMFEAIS